MVVEAEAGLKLTKYPAVELGRMIARREVTALEVAEAHIEQIERVNDALNALVIARFEAARDEAREADRRHEQGKPLGPLDGVPITVKESLEMAGTPATAGINSRRGLNSRSDDPYVARLRAAGAVVLGKTNVAQLLIYYESDNPVYGRTNNPWNPARTAGGSSGGEGAIIAAGGSALGVGTDIGGSLRIPAAFCGVASLKPTSGRTEDVGRLSLPVGQRAVVSQVGLLARHVEDIAAGLEIINGGPCPQPERPMLLGNPKAVDVSRLRVATYADDGTMAPAPAVARAVREATEILRNAGATVCEWTPPDVGRAVHLFYRIMAADGGRGMKRTLGDNEKDPRVATLFMLAGRSHRTLAILRRALQLAGQPSLGQFLKNFGYHDTDHYWQAVEGQIDYRHAFRRHLDEAEDGPYDLILCPPCPLPAFTHGASNDLGTAGGYAILYNLLGYPAGVVPLTRVQPDEEVARSPDRDRVKQAAYEVEEGSAGLPVGVQVVARPWHEHEALAVMDVIQKAATGRPHYPATPVPVATSSPERRI